MMPDVDRVLSRTWPKQWPRFALGLVLAYLVNYVHAGVRPRVLSWFRSESLMELYVRVTSTLIATFTLFGLAALVGCYYFALRNRRTYTGLTEMGLAVRCVLAGIAASVAFVLAIHINAGGFRTG